MLNEKALEAAKKAVKASAIYNPAGDVSSLARPALEAYFRSLPSSPVSELVERLRGIYRIPITDGLGPAGGEEPDNPNEFVRHFETSPIQHEAADRLTALDGKVSEYETGLVDFHQQLTALEAENARLREALEFYADTSKYPAPFTGGFGELYYDCGQVARTALTAPQGGDHD